MKSIVFLLLFAGLIGKPLPQWKEGELDIHAINSARGECTYIILPDGTTMVVDAGEVDTSKDRGYPYVNPKPDASTPAAKVYADYVRHFLPAISRDSIDFFILTHYHEDHMGGVENFHRLLPFRKILDRSYPDYSKKVRTGGTARELRHYGNFVKSNVAGGAFKAEKFEVGSESQLGPIHKSGRNVSITNYAGNGFAWNGNEVVDCHVSRENAMSCAFLVRYGPFEYWTSGDNNGKTVLEATSKAIGHKIEASKCFHHMSNPEQFEIENSVLHPRVIVTQSFYERAIQPHQDIIKSVGEDQDMFFTNISENLISLYPEIYSKCKAVEGHIVIRVNKGGKKFVVYQLDDTSSDYRVKAVFGPYKSK